MKERTRVPTDTEAEVLFQHDHTCCVCREPGLPVQLHHINDNPADQRLENLAVLCLHDHDRTQATGGFGRKLKANEVTRYCNDWLERVIKRRSDADNLAAEKMSGPVHGADSKKWESPSQEILFAYIARLPIIRKRALAAAQPEMDSGITASMTSAAYQVISVFERAWVHLTVWYPPSHFGGVESTRYISQFIADRFIWHRAVCQPLGEGTGGTIVGPMAAAGVMEDLATAIEETVSALLLSISCEEIDVTQWRREWKFVVEGDQSFGETQRASELASDENDCLSILESWLDGQHWSDVTRVLRYVDIDKRLKLVPGSARSYIEQAAERCGYRVARAGAETVLLDREVYC